MKIAEVGQQGSAEWHQFRATKFTASDAPAMLGLSKYKSRSQLLHEKSTGLVEEVSEQMQRLFDKGHKAEADARPIIEKMIGQDLFPVTGVCDVEGLEFLAASFDGLTMCESICFEHKLYNAELAAFINSNQDLPDTHWPQVEHQLLVSGASSCVFTTSDGTESNMTSIEYKSQPERQKAIIDGWKQFKIDLENYQPEQKTEKLTGEVIRDLPALNFEFDKTSLSVISNIEVYKVAASDLVEKSKKPLETDQDFADAESMVKFFKAAEEKLQTVSEQVVGKVVDIDRFVKDVAEISASIRAARLNTEKQVKNRKEQIKLDIVSNAKSELASYVLSLEHDAGYPLPALSVNFAEAIKGKKTVQSLKDAAADELARGKIEANNYAAIIKKNVQIYQEHSKGFNFLFNDFANICLKAHDDMLLLVQKRVSDYEQQEADRKAAEEAKKQADLLKQQQAAQIQQESTNQPQVEPVQQQAYSVRPIALDEAKQQLSNALGDKFANVQPTLEQAVLNWCDSIELDPIEADRLLDILRSFGAIE